MKWWGMRQAIAREAIATIAFLRERGYRYDTHMPSWVHPNPEHWQPTEAENDACEFLDQCTLQAVDVEYLALAADAAWSPPAGFAKD